tara:strand:+ start:396 stop:866 length:471 start_codon:yes stop_codon:yes gene_type:complete
MKPKIPASRIKSDECSINIGQVIEDGEIVNPGTPYFIHQNEWVEILPVMTVKEVVNLSRLQVSGSDPGVLGQNFTDLCGELSRRVIAWNWTDLMGKAIDQPYDRPDVLEKLSSEELLWLVSATTNQETPDERKKGSRQSVDTSSAETVNQTMLPSE